MTAAILIAGALIVGFIVGYTFALGCAEVQHRRERTEWIRGRS